MKTNLNTLRKMRSKGVVALMSACCVVGLSGCASNGMAINTMGGNRVDRVFIEGTIQTQQKVIIADTELAALTGAGAGLAGGAAIGGIAKGGKGALTGGLIGAAAGAATGALIGKEVEAFKTVIAGKDGNAYNGYLANRLREGTPVEFTIVDGKLKNVSIIR